MGEFKDGRKRYEFRHVNDLKLAHPKSMTAPAQRPRLGRPATSSTDVQPSTEAETPPTPTTRQNRFPNPPVDTTTTGSKQTPGSNNSTGRVAPNGTTRSPSHATSTSVGDIPASEPDSGLSMGTGPPPTKPFSTRPVRATRNPAPYYVDAISHTWSATQEELDRINNSINGGCP